MQLQQAITKTDRSLQSISYSNKPNDIFVNSKLHGKCLLLRHWHIIREKRGEEGSPKHARTQEVPIWWTQWQMWYEQTLEQLKIYLNHSWNISTVLHPYWLRGPVSFLTSHVPDTRSVKELHIHWCNLTLGSRGSSVSVETRLRARWKGLNSQQGQCEYIFSSSPRPNRLWVPPSLSIVYRA
jgi:hypothetical protein